MTFNIVKNGTHVFIAWLSKSQPIFLPLPSSPSDGFETREAAEIQAQYIRNEDRGR